MDNNDDSPSPTRGGLRTEHHSDGTGVGVGSRGLPDGTESSPSIETSLRSFFRTFINNGVAFRHIKQLEISAWEERFDLNDDEEMIGSTDMSMSSVQGDMMPDQVYLGPDEGRLSHAPLFHRSVMNPSAHPPCPAPSCFRTALKPRTPSSQFI
jgi:hypothetical protein